MQIFVLGMHRSGTSAVARILNLMGVYFGGEHVSTGRSDQNAKGFWERRDVRDLNDDVLFGSRCDWDCVADFNLDAVPAETKSAYVGAAADIVLNMDAHRPWFVKEPRLCLVFPIWRQVLENPFCIHVLRNPLEVAHSLRTRNGIPIRTGLALWEAYSLHALNASTGLRRVFISYEDLMRDPSVAVERLHSVLVEQGGYDLRVPSGNELNQFLDDALYRHRKTERSLRAVATTRQLQLYKALLGDTDVLRTSSPIPSQPTVEILRRYEKTVDVEGRISSARQARQRRVPESETTQLKLRNLELEHARSLLKGVSQRLDAAERETRQLRRADIEARSTIARSVQKAENLASELDDARKSVTTLAEERSVLQEAKASLEENVSSLRLERSVLAQAKAQLETAQIDARATNAALREALAARMRDSEALERANAALQEKSDRFARERDLLQRSRTELEVARASLAQTNASLNQETEELKLELALGQDTIEQLEQKRAIVEQARLRAETDHAALAARLRRASADVADRQSVVLELTSRWDHELSHRKEVASSLALLASALRSDIVGLLGSRRWRLGRAIVAALYVMSFRRVPGSAGEQLTLVNARFEAKEQLIGEFATSRDDIPRKLAEIAPTTAASVDEVLDDPALRPAEMTVRLVERGLELKRRAQHIDELSAHVESLVTIFEGIVGSWRWRLGNFAISTLHRLVRGKAPATAADSAATLVARFRLGSYADLTTRPVVPMPHGPENGTSGDPARDPSSSVGPTRSAKEPGKNRPVAKPASLNASTPVAVAGTAKPLVHTAESKRELESDDPESRHAIRPHLPAARVDIVVCVHEALEDVRRCLESVLSRTALDFTLIVVNDGSGPETTAWLREMSARHSVVELVETDGPLGYTRAANRGLRASTAPYVVLLNSDTIVPRLWVECLLQCLQTDERLGIVGPLSNAASWQSIPKRFSEDGGWAINDLPVGYNVDEYGELLYRISERAFPRVQFLNGFCLLMRREVIEAIGYLDEDAFPQGYGEENDYCIRAREAGFQLAIADHCFVYHAKSRSFGAQARDRLAEQGRKALWHKYDRKLIEEGTEELKGDPALAEIRSKLSTFFLSNSQSRFVSPVWTAPSARYSEIRVLFILPVRGGSGGANSVVQEVAGMRRLGVDARVAVDARHAESMNHFYSDVLEPDSRVVFASDAELQSWAARFDVIVATLWSTPALIAPIRERWPDKAYVYYVQDYEPWFFPNDPVSRATALDSYTRVPNMALMAKTDWICQTVRERHGVQVFRVTPSLDHDVFYSTDRPRGSSVTLSAMIRPATPRRAPLRTLGVLKDLARRFDGLRILLFGCASDALRALVRRDSELNLDFEFENCGILTRCEVASLLRESDVFVDLSDYQAFGRTGLEAMACGCATVLPAEGGNNEYVVDGENALLVDTTSFEDMTSKIARLIEDRPLREKIGARSLDTAARYSIVRASLSELAVFRWVWTVPGDIEFDGDVYGQGIEPPSDVRAL